MSTITAVNAGATVYFTVRLTGGKFVAAPAGTQFTFGGAACLNGAAVGAAPGCTVTLSADKSTILVTVAAGNTSTTLGLGAFSFTPVAGDINSVNGTLNAVGGKVSASIGLTTTSPTAFEATDAQSSVDLPLATGDLATGARAITPAVDEAPVATASELVLKFLGEQVEMKIKKLRARGAR